MKSKLFGYSHAKVLSVSPPGFFYLAYVFPVSAVCLLFRYLPLPSSGVSTASKPPGQSTATLASICLCAGPFRLPRSSAGGWGRVVLASCLPRGHSANIYCEYGVGLPVRCWEFSLALGHHRVQLILFMQQRVEDEITLEISWQERFMIPQIDLNLGPSGPALDSLEK